MKLPFIATSRKQSALFWALALHLPLAALVFWQWPNVEQVQEPATIIQVSLLSPEVLEAESEVLAEIVEAPAPAELEAKDAEIETAEVEALAEDENPIPETHQPESQETKVEVKETQQAMVKAEREQQLLVEARPIQVRVNNQVEFSLPVVISGSESPSESVSQTKGEETLCEGRGAYDQYVKQRMGKLLHYPRQAKRRGLEGVVNLRFEIAADGMAQETQILVGSGHSVLDRAALELIEKASPFIPPELDDCRLPLAFSLPVGYQLR